MDLNMLKQKKRKAIFFDLRPGESEKVKYFMNYDSRETHIRESNESPFDLNTK